MRPRFFATPSEFRAWLEEHHATAKELLVGFHKKGSGTPSITWPEAVDEALSFGWVDSVRSSIDDVSYTNRFTPRTARSRWSARNIERAKELIAQGRMHPAGR
ncbi:MAG: YdeI/OmpD-associated family protein, partial [Actinomycetota bacterium]